MGQKYETFDVYNYRGDKLKDKLESYLSKGNIAAIIYSNPNNPSWVCLKDQELRIIGELATPIRHHCPGRLGLFCHGLPTRHEPAISTSLPTFGSPTYTDHYILLISGSKAFSYAGQRIGVSCISDKLYHRATGD